MIRPILLALMLLAPLASTTHAQSVAPVQASTLAQDAPELHGMFEAMGLYDILDIMAIEHAQGAEALETNMFPGRGGQAWLARVGALHTSERMTALFEASFPQDAMTSAEITAVTTFMESDAGRRLIEGEVAARLAFLDEDALGRGTDALLMAMETEDVRLDTLMEFNEVNDLVDRNVSGALNARFSFFRGLVDGGAFADEMPEDLMVADVWAQEPEVRQSTVEWLFSFQFLAYADVGNGDLEAYVALSQSEAGQALNAALFRTFDDMLGTLSYEVGYAAAGFIASEEL